jgi:outer membrane lipopolysaccharide assembly protein LptE/RlpB
VTRRTWLALAAAPAAGFAGCGYHVGGHGDQLPETLQTIAIPAFTNITTRYKLTEYLPKMIAREFLTRTRYRVVAEESEADGVLKGSIVNFYAAPTLLDQATNRAAAMQLSVFINLLLIDNKTKKVIYQRNNLEVRQRYEVSSDQRAYFDESDEALQRLSGEVARQVVSTVLETF